MTTANFTARFEGNAKDRECIADAAGSRPTGRVDPAVSGACPQIVSTRIAPAPSRSPHVSTREQFVPQEIDTRLRRRIRPHRNQTAKRESARMPERPHRRRASILAYTIAASAFFLPFASRAFETALPEVPQRLTATGFQLLTGGTNPPGQNFPLPTLPAVSAWGAAAFGLSVAGVVLSVAVPWGLMAWFSGIATVALVGVAAALNQLDLQFRLGALVLEPGFYVALTGLVAATAVNVPLDAKRRLALAACIVATAAFFLPFVTRSLATYRWNSVSELQLFILSQFSFFRRYDPGIPIPSFWGLVAFGSSVVGILLMPAPRGERRHGMGRRNRRRRICDLHCCADPCRVGGGFSLQYLQHIHYGPGCWLGVCPSNDTEDA